MFENIEKYHSDVFDTSLNYLWILHANKIPPHVGISSEGKYFSLKYNGKDEHVSVEKIIELIQKKGIHTVIVQLSSSYCLEDIVTSFQPFERTVSNEITCLVPIEIVLRKERSEKLASLLLKLEAENAITKKIGVHLDDSFTELPHYTQEDIHQRLKLLESE